MKYKLTNTHRLACGFRTKFYDYYPLLLLVTEGIYQQYKLSLLIMIVKGEKNENNLEK